MGDPRIEVGVTRFRGPDECRGAPCELLGLVDPLDPVHGEQHRPPGEDGRQQSGFVGGLLEGPIQVELLAADVGAFAEEQVGHGPVPARGQVGEVLGQQRGGPVQVTAHHVAPGQGQHAVGAGRVVGRGEPQRVEGQLLGQREVTALDRTLGAPGHVRGQIGVGSHRGHGQVADAQRGVGDRAGQIEVEVPPFRGRRLVPDDGRQQRVDGPDHRPLDHQHRLRHGVLHHERIDDRRELVTAEPGAQRHGRQGPADLRRQPPGSGLQQVLDGARHRQVGPGSGNPRLDQRPAEFHREQRIAPGAVEHVAHHPSGQWRVEPSGQELAYGAEAQALDLEGADPDQAQLALDGGGTSRMPRAQDADR